MTQAPEKNAPNQEVRYVTVRRMTAYLYTSMYLSFGWTLEETTVPVGSPVYTRLRFTRPKSIRDPASTLALWRQFDAAVGEIEAQERIQSGCTRKAVLFGFTGFAFLAVSFFVPWFTAPSFLHTLLSCLGLIICACAFLFYCAIYKRRSDEFAENLCRNYQTIYQVCAQAAAHTAECTEGGMMYAGR